MRKPVSEHSTTIKARKGDPPAPQQGMLEPVGGGSVRRVEFEGDRRPVEREPAQAERAWHPRARDSIDQIHFEVDNLHRLRRPGPRARSPRDAPETRRVFDTPRGSVKESHMSTSQGERKVLYTSRRSGGTETDQRFHSGLVDRIIAQRYKDGPSWTPAQDEEKPKRGWLRKGKGKDEPAAEPTMDEAAPTPAKLPFEAAEEADDLPFPPPGEAKQCAAVTKAGLQCKNTAMADVAYCSSHRDHRPRRLKDVLDTEPFRGEDTEPGVGDRAGTGQCAAYTKEGMQCRRNSRVNSKYCSVHRGYRPPSKEALAKRLDTLPRNPRAKDTKPKVR